MGLAEGISKNIQGMTSIVGGMIGGRARRREERKAQAEFQSMKSQYQGLDTSNLAADYQNTYEDLTVNTQQADFIAEQQQQTYGDTMDKLSQSAGGSGIASLAQAMANQQAKNLQAASASIGTQESKNQMAAARGADIQQRSVLAGEEKARTLETEKVETLFGMSQQRLAAATAARAKATDQLVSGVGNAFAGAAEVGISVATGGFSDILDTPPPK